MGGDYMEVYYEDLVENPRQALARIGTFVQHDLETSIGVLLSDTGYKLETPPAELHSSLAVRFMNFLYPLYFDFKLWLKSNTPLARIADKAHMGKAESDAKPVLEFTR